MILIEKAILPLITFLVICSPVIQYHQNKYRCELYAEEMNTESRFSFYGGCRIKLDDKYIPLKNLRGFE